MRLSIALALGLSAACSPNHAGVTARSGDTAGTPAPPAATESPQPRDLPAVAIVSPLRADRLRDLRFSPDGRLLALATGFEETLLFDAKDGALRAVLLQAGMHSSALAWSPDSKRLAAAKHGVVIWDLKNASPFRTLAQTESGANIAALAWSPDGKTIAAGYVRKVLRWSAETGATLPTWQTPGWVSGLEFLPGGALAVSDESGVLTVYEADGTLRFAQKKAPGGAVPYKSVRVSPDGSTLAVGDPTVLLDAKTGERRQLILTQGLQGRAAFDPTGKVVAFDTGGTLRRFSVGDAWPLDEVVDDAPRPGTGFIPDSFDWSSDGSRWATGLDFSVTLWDAKAKKPLRRLWGSPPNRVSNRRLVVQWHGDRILEARGDLRVWSAKSGALIAELQPSPDDYIGEFALNPGGTRALIAFGSGKLVLIDLSTGETLAEAVGPIMPTCVRFVSDQRVAIARNDDPTAVLRDANSLAAVDGQKPARCYVERLGQPGGHWALSLEEGANVVDTRSGVLLRQLTSDQYPAAAFSPSGKLLAMSVTGEITIWSTKSWKPERSFPIAGGRARFLRFGPNHDQLIVSTGHGVEVRDSTTGSVIARAPTTSHDTAEAAISADGKFLARSDLYGLRLDRLADGAVLHFVPLEGKRSVVLSGAGCADGADAALADLSVRAGRDLLTAKLLPMSGAGGGARCSGLVATFMGGGRLPLPPLAHLEE